MDTGVVEQEKNYLKQDVGTPETFRALDEFLAKPLPRPGAVQE